MSTDEDAQEPRPRRATIADVARHARVAKSTVSNYLNGHVRVSPDVTARVATAIAELDYKPSQIARSFTSRRMSQRATSQFRSGVPCLTTVGHVSVDYIAAIAALPHREDRINAREIFKALGGPAANVAVIAAGLGQPWAVAVSLITLVGEDQDSDWAVAELGLRNVAIVPPTEPRDGRLARALILVEPTGKRTIIAEPLRVGQFDVAHFVTSTDAATSRRCLHFEGFQVPQQISSAKMAREAGFLVTMQSTGLTAEWIAAHAGELFRSYDIAIFHHQILHGLVESPSKSPEALVTWIAARASLADGDDWPAAVLVFFDYTRAALVRRDGTITWAEAPLVNVIDETGAIDAFAGAFLALWLNDVPLDQALRVAIAAASLAVTQFGAQEVRPDAADLLAMLDVATVL